LFATFLSVSYFLVAAVAPNIKKNDARFAVLMPFIPEVYHCFREVVTSQWHVPGSGAIFAILRI